MSKYLWRGGKWVPADKVRRSAPQTANIMRDIKPYRSPLGTGEITSRSHRREDLKRGGCREVDPSEFKAEYHSKRFAEKIGRPWTPEDQ